MQLRTKDTSYSLRKSNTLFQFDICLTLGFECIRIYIYTYIYLYTNIYTRTKQLSCHIILNIALSQQMFSCWHYLSDQTNLYIMLQ